MFAMAHNDSVSYEHAGMFDSQQQPGQPRRAPVGQMQLPQNLDQFINHVTAGKLQSYVLADFCEQCIGVLRQQDRHQLQEAFNLVNSDDYANDDQILLQFTLLEAFLSKNLDQNVTQEVLLMVSEKVNALLLRRQHQQQLNDGKKAADPAVRDKPLNAAASSTVAADGATSKRARNGEQKRLASKSQGLGETQHVYLRRMMSFLNTLSSVLVRMHLAADGIPLMENAIGLLQSSSEQLTAPHAFYVHLCFASGQFARAKGIVSTTFSRINNISNNYDAHYYMSYHYHAGCIMAQLEQYKQAMLLFSRAVCTPAGSLSLLTVQALRKLILVSLIEKWKFDLDAQPVAVRTWFQRSRKTNSVYLQVVRMFTETSNFSRQAFQQYLREHEQEFENDRNLELIGCCVEARIARQLKMLAAVYDNVPVQTLLDRVQLATLNELLENLRRLKTRHDVLYEFNEQKQVVRFHGLAAPPPPDALSAHMSIDAEITQLTSDLFAAQATLAKFEHCVANDDKFIARIRKALHTASGGGGGGGGKHMMLRSGGGGMFDDDDLTVIGDGIGSAGHGGGSRYNGNARRGKRAGLGGGGASSSGGDASGFMNGGDHSYI